MRLARAGPLREQSGESAQIDIGVSPEFEDPDRDLQWSRESRAILQSVADLGLHGDPKLRLLGVRVSGLVSALSIEETGDGWSQTELPF